MPRLFLPLLATLMAAPSLGSGTQESTAANEAAYAVAYVEVTTSATSRTAALTAFREYEAARNEESGYIRFEIFEQSEAPGHFAVIETWLDVNALGGRRPAAYEKLLLALGPIRVSDYDQRLYRSLTVGPSLSAPGGQAVHVIAHVDVSPSSTGGPELLRRAAEAGRRDRGNERFDVLQHSMRANHFTLIEAWESHEARQAHVEAIHTRQYRDQLGPITGSPLDQRDYNAVE